MKVLVGEIYHPLHIHTLRCFFRLNKNTSWFIEQIVLWYALGTTQSDGLYRNTKQASFSSHA